MPIERLTAEDEMMLWPDATWPQDIGALAFLDGRRLFDAHGRFRIEASTEAIAARLHRVPRFRQLLWVPPRRLGGPLWVDAPAFDLSQHTGVVPVPAPGGEAEVLAAVEDLRRRRLDRSRPLWEMWFLTGLGDGRVGLFVRMHHCIADGMAGVATMASFLDPDGEVTPARPQAWTPRPMPSEAELLDDARARQRGRHRHAFERLAHPIRTAELALGAWPAVRELFAEPAGPATSLNRLVGTDRKLALIRSSLRLVKDIAHANGAKVNDVLLAVIAGGLRGLLSSRGEAVAGVVLPVYVPVSLHPGQHSEARGNLISQMVVPLPIGLMDPVPALRQIAVETARRKARARPSLGVFPHRGVAGRLALKLVARQRVNVSSADLPGPDFPLYFAGARLLEVFPMVQILGNNTLAIGAMSYAGQFNLMAVADRATYPDLDVFVRSAEDQLRALAAASSTAVPA